MWSGGWSDGQALPLGWSRAITNASYKCQQRNDGVTEIVEIPNRGHSLTVDHGRQDAATTALTFVKAHSLLPESVWRGTAKSTPQHGP